VEVYVVEAREYSNRSISGSIHTTEDRASLTRCNPAALSRSATMYKLSDTIGVSAINALRSAKEELQDTMETYKDIRTTSPQPGIQYARRDQGGGVSANCLLFLQGIYTDFFFAL